jgi:Zn-dependent peptidase ImmA (M78 family)/transcriptional regulator with XRE-family HTH domain
MSPRSIMADATPTVLRWGRESAGLTVDDVAERLHKDAGVVRAWEAGDTRPTIRQLERLAELYKRPLVIFYLPEPPQEPPSPTDFRMLPADRRRDLSPTVRFAIRRARRVQRLYAQLTDELGIERSVALPHSQVRDDPERIAATFRRRIGVTLDQQRREWDDVFAAFREWRRQVEQSGVLVLQAGMPVDETRGFSLTDGPAPIILLSTKDFVSPRIFTLFHEVAHIMLNTGGICIPELGGPLQQDPTVEQFCNHFAGAFLVPLEALERIAVPATPRELDDAMRRTARSLKVSRYVVLRRLLIAGRLSYARFQETIGRWLAEPMTASSGGPSSPAEKVVSRYGTTFVSTVLEAQARGNITASDVADFLSVKVNHLQEVETIVSARRRG